MVNVPLQFFRARRRRVVRAALILSLAVGAGTTSPVQAEEMSLLARHQDTMEIVYQDRGDRPIWVAGGRLNQAARSFIFLLQQAELEGLRPADYGADALANLLISDPHPTPMVPAPLDREVEYRLTAAFLTYGRDLSRGRLDPDLIYSRWDRSGNTADVLPVLADILVAASDADLNPGFDLASALDQIRPDTNRYRKLAESLSFYRQVAASGGWPVVTPGDLLRPGDEGPRVARLRTRLTGLSEPEIFDDDLAAAVRRFQARHGLQPDALVGEKTLVALNESAAHKADRIALNLERLRWLPPEPADPFVRVNIPSCRLEVIEEGRAVLTMKTVVGRPDRPTPVMRDRIGWVELNPYWNVPQKLVRKDILPKVLADSLYLADRNFRVYETWRRGAKEIDVAAVDWAGLESWNIAFRFRQDPGPRNPLGRMKFLFPNEFSIYLHDTNQRDAFGRDARWLSSGCVRLEDPGRLAAYLAPEADLETALQKKTNRTIGLRRKVPILMVYQTVWVDEAGQVNFAPDIYGYDARMKVVLEGRDLETLVAK